MSEEIDEAAGTVAEHVAAAGLGVRVRPSRPAALESDAGDGECANCRTGLKGPVCHVCGQVDDGYHRPIGSLVAQIVEGLVYLDGRVARTLPGLMIRPGEVTRRYLKGQRARFIPPFRLYLIASLAFFLLLGLMADGPKLALPAEQAASLDSAREEVAAARESGEMTAEEAAQALTALDMIDRAAAPLRAEAARSAEEGAAGETAGAQAPGEPAGALQASIEEKLRRIAADPERWADETMAWVPRIMFVLVPIYAGLLALSFLWRRGYFYYDHLIVSLHLHSALFLAMALGVLAAPLIGAGWVLLGLLVYSNAYLYRMHRVVYARSRITSVLRTLALDLAYLLVMAFALVGVVILGFFSV